MPSNDEPTKDKMTRDEITIELVSKCRTTKDPGLRTKDQEPRTMNQGERMPCKIEFLVDIVVEPDESEFLAYCPALKGLHVGGATVKEDGECQ